MEIRLCLKKRNKKKEKKTETGPSTCMARYGISQFRFEIDKDTQSGNGIGGHRTW